MIARPLGISAQRVESRSSTKTKLAAGPSSAAVAVGYAGRGSCSAARVREHAGKKGFQKTLQNRTNGHKQTRAAHPLPSLMTNVLPALPHARRSARGVPMNAEPDAEAAWVFASTWKTVKGLELGIQMKTGYKTNAVNYRGARAGRTVSQFRSPAVSSIMSFTNP